MKYFKKLFLSAATIFLTTSTVDPAHAFSMAKGRKATSNAQQQMLQSNTNPKMIDASNAQLEAPLLLLKEILGSHDQVEVKKLSEELIAHLIKLNGNKIDLAQGVVSAVKNLEPNRNDLQALREEILALKEEISHLRKLTASHQQKPQEDDGNFNVHPINQPDPLSFDVLPTHHLTSLSTSRDSEDKDSQQSLLSEFATARPLDDQTPSSTPILSSSQETLASKNFDQTIFGIKPSNLEEMSESELELWRTFTMLYHANEDSAKPWSSWGGAYSTEELEEKFKDNSFMKSAFKEISSSLLSSSSIVFFPDYITYYKGALPQSGFNPEANTDLTKAYYFRGLYRILTGNNCSGRNENFSAAEFEIDSTKGLKGSRYTYGSSSSISFGDGTPLYEAEEHFKNTPWHTLFVQKVITATVASLPNLMQKTQEIMEKYNPEILRLKNLIAKNDFKKDPQELTTTNQEGQKEPSVKQLNEELFKIAAQKNQEIENLNTQKSRVLKATTLHEIDEALGIL